MYFLLTMSRPQNASEILFEARGCYTFERASQKKKNECKMFDRLCEQFPQIDHRI